MSNVFQKSFGLILLQVPLMSTKIFPRTVFIKEAVIPKERKMKKTTNPKLTLSTPLLIVPKDVGWSA